MLEGAESLQRHTWQMRVPRWRLSPKPLVCISVITNLRRTYEDGLKLAKVDPDERRLLTNDLAKDVHQASYSNADTGNGSALGTCEMSRVPGTRGYAKQAQSLISQYESLSFERVHEVELHLLPSTPSRILDIGAGTGRDAAWFATRGHTILAVEPTLELRLAGMKLHPSPSIEWLDDALPELSLVTSRGQLFDTIMLNAVWMHLNPLERHTGMAKIATLMACNGILMLSLRHGPIPDGRRMFDVSAEETIGLAGLCGLLPVLNVETMSVQAGNRAADVKWTRLVFKR